MFGLQRVGDLVWAAGDMRTHGFMLGGTSGRTTLNGEGLQHQDGNSQLLAYPVPNMVAYDPAFAYELATIIQDGIRRMYVEQEPIFYYLTVMNEPWEMPEMPEGSKEGILKGIYKFKPSVKKDAKLRASLLGSGAMMQEVIKAQQVLEDKYGVAADIYSVTSYKNLYFDGIATERWNMLHPGEKEKIPFVSEMLKDSGGVVVAASDYVKALPESISKWIPGRMVALGTDGFGRSESRENLRNHFEVDAKHIVLATLSALMREGKVKADAVKGAIKELGINPEKPNPVVA
jgi:pyruvate dehydrogenase E1 component